MQQLTGTQRRIDKVGRLFIPIELRNCFHFENNVTYCSISVSSNNSIIIRKHDSRIKCLARKLDKKGKLSIPIEIRRRLNISEETPLDFYVTNDSIIIKNAKCECIFCHSSNKDFKIFQSKKICVDCFNTLITL